MRCFLLTVLSLAVAASAMVVNPSPVAAAGTPLTICNQTSVPLTVTTGYHSSGVNDTAGSNILTGPFVSHGYSVIAAGACAPFPNPFNARYMFWFGIDHAKLNTGILFWDTNGNDHYCMPDVYAHNSELEPFTFENENASQTACESGHFQSGQPNIWVPVRSVDVMVNPTVNFTGE